MTTPNTPDCTCRPDPKHPGWWYECPQHVGTHPNPGSLAGHEHRFHSGLCANKPCDVSSSDYIATLYKQVLDAEEAAASESNRAQLLEARLEAAERALSWIATTTLENPAEVARQALTRPATAAEQEAGGG